MPSPATLLSPADAIRRVVVGKKRNLLHEFRLFLCQITILFHGINFPRPASNAFRMRKPYCVNSKLCKLLKLAILLISRVEFCSWTMHTDPVVPLTGLFFNVLCMSLAETTSWPSLQYLLIDVIDGHRILSHISFPACGSE